jgi:hypothetical protein
MSEEMLSRVRYGEAFWRAHHEAWRRSDLNQREYCEAQGVNRRGLRPTVGMQCGPSLPAHKPFIDN